MDGEKGVLIRKINLAAGIKRAPKFIHDDYVRAVTYSNDGKYITTGDDVKKVIVRDAVTGETEYEFKVPGWIYSLCYLKNGDLAVGLRNGVVFIYNSSVFVATEKWGKGQDKSLRAAVENYEEGYKFTEEDWKTVSSKVRSANISDKVTGEECSKRWIEILCPTKFPEKTSLDMVVSALSADRSDNGNLLAIGYTLKSGKKGDLLVLYNTETGKEVRKFNHNDGVSTVSFSPDGMVIAAGDASSKVYLRYVTSLEDANLNVFDHDDAVNCISFSEDGTMLAVGDDAKNLTIRDIRKRGDTIINTFVNGGKVLSLSFTKSGEYIASGDSDGWIRVRKAKEISTDVLFEYQQGGQIFSLDYSSDNQKLVASSSSGVVMVHEASEQAELPRYKTEGIVSSISYSPQGDMLAICDNNYGVGTLTLHKSPFLKNQDDKIATKSSEKPIVHACSGKLLGVCFSPNPKDDLVATAGDASGIIVRGSKSGDIILMEHIPTALEIEAGHGAVRSVAFNATGEFIAYGLDACIMVRHVKSGDVINMFQQSATATAIYSIAFSLDDKLIVSGNKDNQVVLNEFINDHVKDPYFHHEKTVTSVSFSPNDNGKYTAVASGGILIRDMSTGTVIKKFDEHVVNSVDYSPCGDFIAAGTQEQSTVIRTTDGIIVDIFQHSGNVNMVKYSPDGSLLATADTYKRLILWEAKGGKEVASYKHEEKTGRVSFSPDGSLLATSDEAGTVIIRKTNSGDKEKIVAQYEQKVLFHSPAIAWTPDGSWLAIGGGYETEGVIKGTVTIRKSSEIGDNSKSTKEISEDKYVYSLAFSKDGAFIFVIIV